jgi:hypothetical protein
MDEGNKGKQGCRPTDG